MRSVELLPRALANFLSFFEQLRQDAQHSPRMLTAFPNLELSTDRAFGVYESRSAARVADVSSVVLRDAISWVIYAEHALLSGRSGLAEGSWGAQLKQAFREAGSLEDDLLTRRLLERGWGQLP